MNVEHIEVLVEEPSMEAALRTLLPSILGDKTFEVHAYQGKQNLLKHLPQRLCGYKNWLPDNCRIVVVVDQDDDDCHELKTRLEQIALGANFGTRTSSHGTLWTVVNRLAIEELESWYFGDWNAVRAAYPRVPLTIPSRAKYRNPDAIVGGTWEALERILKRAGYFSGGLRKIEAAKNITRCMVPERNRSHSFQVLLSVLHELANS